MGTNGFCTWPVLDKHEGYLSYLNAVRNNFEPLNDLFFIRINKVLIETNFVDFCLANF